jgi:hypothetical protein
VERKQQAASSKQQAASSKQEAIIGFFIQRKNRIARLSIIFYEGNPFFLISCFMVFYAGLWRRPEVFNKKL